MAEVVKCSDCGKKSLMTRLIQVRGSKDRVCSSCQVKRFRGRMGRTASEPCQVEGNASWYRDTEWFVKVFCVQTGHPEWAGRSKWRPPPGYVEPRKPSIWDTPST